MSETSLFIHCKATLARARVAQDKMRRTLTRSKFINQNGDFKNSYFFYSTTTGILKVKNKSAWLKFEYFWNLKIHLLSGDHTELIRIQRVPN